MNGRNVVLAAVAIALVGIIIAFFTSAGDTGDPASARVPVAASAPESAGALPAGEAAPAAPEPRSRARDRQVASGEAEEKRVELPPEARPEDGGIAFGVSVCDKLESCDCARSPAENCAKGWISVTPEDYRTASCLLDLGCEDICRMYDHPTDVPCLVQVDQMVQKRILDR